MGWRPKSEINQIKGSSLCSLFWFITVFVVLVHHCVRCFWFITVFWFFTEFVDLVLHCVPCFGSSLSSLFWFITLLVVFVRHCISCFGSSLCSLFCLLLCLFMIFKPAHEIMTLFVLRKLIFQMRMRSHPARCLIFWSDPSSTSILSLAGTFVGWLDGHLM